MKKLKTVHKTDKKYTKKGTENDFKTHHEQKKTLGKNRHRRLSNSFILSFLFWFFFAGVDCIFDCMWLKWRFSFFQWSS